MVDQLQTVVASFAAVEEPYQESVVQVVVQVCLGFQESLEQQVHFVHHRLAS